MITRQNIQTLYKQYPERAGSVDNLDIALLYDEVAENHGAYVDPDTDELIIMSIDAQSPFHAIPVSKIHAIVPFEQWVAIVLHSSIIFLNRESSKVAVDIKPVSRGLAGIFRDVFAGEKV